MHLKPSVRYGLNCSTYENCHCSSRIPFWDQRTRPNRTPAMIARTLERQIVGIVVIEIGRNPIDCRTERPHQQWRSWRVRHIRVSYLIMMSAFAITFATPNHIVGNGYPGTTYFSTRTVCVTVSRLFCYDIGNASIKADHRTSKPSSHKSKSEKQHQSGFPRYAIARVAKRVSREPRFLDGIYDEHAEGGANAWYPVDEVDMYLGSIGCFGVHSRIKEEKEAKGELEGMLAESYASPTLSKKSYQSARNIYACRPCRCAAHPLRFREAE